MTESPYAMPLEEFVATAQVPRAAQVEELAEPRPPVVDPTAPRYADDGVDGDGD